MTFSRSCIRPALKGRSQGYCEPVLSGAPGDRVPKPVFLQKRAEGNKSWGRGFESRRGRPLTLELCLLADTLGRPQVGEP